MDSETTKFKGTQKFNGVKSAKWFRNVAKSLGYSVKNELKNNIMPTTFETIEINVENFKELKSFMRSSDKSQKMIDKMLGEKSEYIRGQLSDIKKNAIADLKSGNINNKAREDAVVNKMDDDFGDISFNDSFDDSGFDEDIDIESGTTAAVGYVAEAVDNQSMVLVETAKQSAKQQVELTKLSISADMEMTNKLYSGMDVINSNLAKLVGFSSDISSFIGAGLKYFEDTTKVNTEILDLLRSIAPKPKEEKEYKPSIYDDLYTSSGGLNLKAYGKVIARNMKNMSESNMATGMISSIFDYFKEGNLESIVANPLGFALESVTQSLMPKMLTNAAKQFDETFKSFIPAFFSRLAMIGNNGYDKEGNFIGGALEKIGKLFGIDSSIKTKIDTSLYEKGAVPFDGITRKSIVEVIPAYLSKIYAALSGKEEMIYDFDKGKFTSKKEIESEYRSQVRNATTSYDAIGNITERSKAYGFDKKSQDVFDEAVNNFFSRLSQTTATFNPRAKSSKDHGYLVDDFFKDNNGRDLGPKAKEAFITLLSTMSEPELIRLAGQRVENQREGTNFFKQQEQNPTTAFTSQFNGLFGDNFDLSKNNLHVKNKDAYVSGKKTDFRNSIFTPLDKYGMTSLDYLRNINRILLDKVPVVMIKGGRDEEKLQRFDSMKDITQRPDDFRDSDASGFVYEDDPNGADMESLVAAYDSEHEKKTNYTEGKISKFLSKSKFGTKIKNKFSPWIQKADGAIKDTSDKVYGFMYKLLFGDTEDDKVQIGAAFDRISAKIKGAFTSLKDWFRDDVFTPIKDTFFKPIMDTFFTPLKENLLGVDGKGGLLDKIKETQTVQNLKEKGKELLDGFKNSETGLSFKEGLANAKNTVVSKISEGVQSFSDTVFGTKIDKETGEKISNVTSSEIFNKIKSRAPKALATGLGTSVLAGAGGLGLLGSMFLGPIGGIAVGAGASFLSQSEKFKDFVFGKYDENEDERIGGLISRSTQDFIQKHKKGIIAGGIGGSLAGMGLLPSMIAMGPVGGAILGLASSILFKSEKFQDFMFGAKEKITGKLKSIKEGGFLKSKAEKTYGDAIDESAESIKDGAVSLKEKWFGTFDEDGNRATNGIIQDLMGGTVKNLLLPLKVQAQQWRFDIQNWFKDDIAEPIRDAYAPLKEEMRRIKNRTIEFFDDLIGKFSIKDKITDLGQSIKDKVSEATNFIKEHTVSAINSIGKTIGGVISAPIKMASNAINKTLLKKHQKEGLSGMRGLIMENMVDSIVRSDFYKTKLKPFADKASIFFDSAKDFFNEYKEKIFNKMKDIGKFLFKGVKDIALSPFRLAGEIGRVSKEKASEKISKFRDKYDQDLLNDIVSNSGNDADGKRGFIQSGKDLLMTFVPGSKMRATGMYGSIDEESLRLRIREQMEKEGIDVTEDELDKRTKKAMRRLPGGAFYDSERSREKAERLAKREEERAKQKEIMDQLTEALNSGAGVEELNSIIDSVNGLDIDEKQKMKLKRAQKKAFRAKMKEDALSRAKNVFNDSALPAAVQAQISSAETDEDKQQIRNEYIASQDEAFGAQYGKEYTALAKKDKDLFRTELEANRASINTEQHTKGIFETLKDIFYALTGQTDKISGFNTSKTSDESQESSEETPVETNIVPVNDNIDSSGLQAVKPYFDNIATSINNIFYALTGQTDKIDIPMLSGFNDIYTNIGYTDEFGQFGVQHNDSALALPSANVSDFSSVLALPPAESEYKQEILQTETHGITSDEQRQTNSNILALPPANASDFSSVLALPSADNSVLALPSADNSVLALPPADTSEASSVLGVSSAESEDKQDILQTQTHGITATETREAQEKQSMMDKLFGVFSSIGKHTKDTAESSKKHSIEWGKIFSKEGLITAGLLVGVPLLIKAIKWVKEKWQDGTLFSGIADAIKEFLGFGDNNGDRTNSSGDVQVNHDAVENLASGAATVTGQILRGPVAKIETGVREAVSFGKKVKGIVKSFKKGAGEAVEEGAGEAVEKGASKVAGEVTEKGASETAETASKVLATRTKKGTSKAASEVVSEVTEKGAREATEEVVERGATDLLSNGAEKALRESVEAGLTSTTKNNSKFITKTIDTFVKMADEVLASIPEFIKKNFPKISKYTTKILKSGAFTAAKKALSNFNPVKIAKELLEKLISKITKNLSADAAQAAMQATGAATFGISNAVGIAIEATTVVYGGLSGATASEAANLFRVDQKYVDGTMRLISGVMKAILNLPIVWVIDIVNDLTTSLLGVDFLGELAVFLYDLMASDAEKEKLDEARASFNQKYEDYTLVEQIAKGNVQYDENGNIKKDKDGNVIYTDSSKIESKDSFNDRENKTLIGKGWDGIKKAGQWVADGAFDLKTKIFGNKGNEEKYNEALAQEEALLKAAEAGIVDPNSEYYKEAMEGIQRTKKRNETIDTSFGQIIGNMSNFGKNIGSYMKTDGMEVFSSDYWTPPATDDGTIVGGWDKAAFYTGRILMAIPQGIKNVVKGASDFVNKIIGNVSNFGNTVDGYMNTDGLTVFSKEYWTPQAKEDGSVMGTWDKIAFYTARVLMMGPQGIKNVVKSVSDKVTGFIGKVKSIFSFVAQNNADSNKDIEEGNHVFTSEYWNAPTYGDEKEEMGLIPKIFFYGQRVLSLPITATKSIVKIVSDKVTAVINKVKPVFEKMASFDKDSLDDIAKGNHVFTAEYWKAPTFTSGDGSTEELGLIPKILFYGQRVLALPVTATKSVIKITSDAITKLIGNVQNFANTVDGYMDTDGLAVTSSEYWTAPSTDDGTVIGGWDKAAFYTARVLMFVPQGVKNIVKGISNFITKAIGNVTGFTDTVSSYMNTDGLAVTSGQYWTPPAGDDGTVIGGWDKAAFYTARVLMFVPQGVKNIVKGVSSFITKVIGNIGGFTDAVGGYMNTDGLSVTSGEYWTPPSTDDSTVMSGWDKAAFYTARVLMFVPQGVKNIVTGVVNGVKNVIGNIEGYADSVKGYMNVDGLIVTSSEYWTPPSTDDDSTVMSGWDKAAFYTSRVLMFVPQGVKNIVTGITDTVKNVIGTVTDISSAIKSYADVDVDDLNSSFFTPPSDLAQDDSLVGGIKRVGFYFTRGIMSVWLSIKKLFNPIVEKFTAMKDWFKDKLGALYDTLGLDQLFDGSGSFNFGGKSTGGYPNIRHQGTGGGLGMFQSYGMQTAGYPTYNNSDKPHYGIDKVTTNNNPVPAFVSGKVTETVNRYAPDSGKAQENHEGGFGNYVKVQDHFGGTNIYGHLNKVSVKPGDYINQGDIIGNEGHTGNSTGHHLHFETWAGSTNKDVINPYSYLQSIEGMQPGIGGKGYDILKSNWKPYQTSPFGMRSGGFHHGVDFGVAKNTKIPSFTDGEVVMASKVTNEDGYLGNKKYNGGYGNLLKIKDSSGHFIYYAHLNDILVKKGDKVNVGDEVALSGHTGNSSGPHLHLEVRPPDNSRSQNTKYDPYNYFQGYQDQTVESSISGSSTSDLSTGTSSSGSGWFDSLSSVANMVSGPFSAISSILGNVVSSLTGSSSGSSSGSSAVSNMASTSSKALTGSSDEEKIWNYLISNGITPNGAAGIMGNLKAESNLRSDNLEDAAESALNMSESAYADYVNKNNTFPEYGRSGTMYGKTSNDLKNRVGYGLAQWTWHTRKDALAKLRQQKNVSISDIGLQLEFLLNELNSSDYDGMLKEFKDPETTLQEASDKFLLDFENPADKSGAVKQKRAKFGKEYYDKFAKSLAGEDGTGGGIGGEVDYSSDRFNIDTPNSSTINALKTTLNSLQTSLDTPTVDTVNTNKIIDYLSKMVELLSNVSKNTKSTSDNIEKLDKTISEKETNVNVIGGSNNINNPMYNIAAERRNEKKNKAYNDAKTIAAGVH